MKKKLLLALVLSFLNGCVAYKPVASSTTALHSGVSLVTPGWQGKTTFWSRAWPYFVGPMLMGGVGAAYYQRDPTAFVNQNTGQRPSIGVAVGGLMAVGIYVPGAIPLAFFRSKRGAKPKAYDETQALEWTHKYNRGLSVYKVVGHSLLVGPNGKQAMFDAEEARRAEAERQRLAAIETARQAEAERQRLALVAAEIAAYQAFKKDPAEGWELYLKNYPDGANAAEVKLRGEGIAYRKILRAEPGALDTYKRYFPAGNNLASVRAFEPIYSELMAIRKDWLDATYYKDYMAAKTRAEAFRGQVEAWYARQEQTNPAQLVNELGTPADARTRLRDYLELIDKGAATALTREQSRQLVIARWVVGDNLCWEAESYSIDKNGDRIPGTEGKTLIRAAIEATTANNQRIQLRVKELYDLQERRNAGSFSMSHPRRVWRKDELDWIDPQEMKFDLCK